MFREATLPVFCFVVIGSKLSIFVITSISFNKSFCESLSFLKKKVIKNENKLDVI